MLIATKLISNKGEAFEQDLVCEKAGVRNPTLKLEIHEGSKRPVIVSLLYANGWAEPRFID